MKLKVRLELLLDVDYPEDLQSENEVFDVVRQELSDMLYVAVEPDQEDILSVTDMKIRFMKVEDDDTPISQ